MYDSVALGLPVRQHVLVDRIHRAQGLLRGLRVRDAHAEAFLQRNHQFERIVNRLRIEPLILTFGTLSIKFSTIISLMASRRSSVGMGGGGS